MAETYEKVRRERDALRCEVQQLRAENKSLVAMIEDIHAKVSLLWLPGERIDEIDKLCAEVNPLKTALAPDLECGVPGQVMDDLVDRLRQKASIMEMGERIPWGSDTALMREAADQIESLKKSTA